MLRGKACPEFAEGNAPQHDIAKEDSMTNTPSTEDRIWAVISHLSAIAFGMGILLPVIGWSEQRRKSSYASFQCLQALGYQSLGYTVWILSYLLGMILVLVIVIVMSFRAGVNGENLDVFSGTWMALIFVVIFGSFALYFLLPVIAAVACALGRDFRYPIIGNRLARYLGYDPTRVAEESIWLIEDHEDRWVAAMGHFSVIIAIWGMLAPLAAWIVQGKHSLFLRFQSIQTLVYQIGATLLPFVAMFFCMFGFFIFVVVTGFGENSSLNSSTGIAGLVILLGSMLIAAGIVMVIPLVHILGQYAGYRILKGDDYRYPVIGRLVEKRLAQSGSSRSAAIEPE